MYQSSADFSGPFMHRDKSRKTFNIVLSTKLVYLKLRFVGAATRHPPPEVRHDSASKYIESGAKIT